MDEKSSVISFRLPGPSGTPHTVTKLVEHGRSRDWEWLPAEQVRRHYVGSSEADRARFRHALAGVPRSTTRDADSRECAWLRAVGAAQPGAGKTKLCTLATVCRVLQKLGVASNSVQALASIRMDGGCNYELSASVAAASLHSVLPTLTQPATLPAMEFSQADLSEEYGLAVIRPGLLSRGTLSIQLDQLEAFSKMDVNTRRHGSRQATATYDGTVKKVHQYLGFCIKFLGIQQPGLTDFLDAERLSKFWRFTFQKHCTSANFDGHIVAARYVASMFASHETAAETKALYEAHIAWLSCMRSEVCRELPLHQYDREDPLPLPEDVLAFVEIVKRRAEADHDWAMTKPRARVHMDAGLVSFVFGHVAPVRPSVLASLTRPDYTGPCMHPDCRGPKTCKGNSLRWTTAGHVDLVFRAAHHKMARKRRFAPIGPVVLPRALTKVLRRYLEEGYQLLAKSDTPFVFVGKSGRQLAANDFSRYWRGLLEAAGCPAVHLICPQKLRTIFVGERYSPNAAPGPSNEGAAAMMGNTVSTWEKVYDRTRHLRNIQQAADGMDEWRSALLARGKAGWQGAGEAAPGEEAATRGPLDSPALQAPRSAGTSKSAKRQKVCSGAESEDLDDTEAGSDAGTYWSAVSVSDSEVEQPKQVCRGGGLQQLMWEVMESRK